MHAHAYNLMHDNMCTGVASSHDNDDDSQKRTEECSHSSSQTQTLAEASVTRDEGRSDTEAHTSFLDRVSEIGRSRSNAVRAAEAELEGMREENRCESFV
jgi:hypothetical protein